MTVNKSLSIKIALAVYTLVLFTLQGNAQVFDKPDAKAPHDIAYYRETKVTKPVVKVVYGRPSIEENEKAFGEKIPYGEIWGTGANEATEIKLYENVLFGNKLIEAGTYVLVTIPGEKEWEIILNSNLDVLGAHQYSAQADVLRIKVPVSKAERINVFSIAFKKNKNQILMAMGWDSTRVKIPITPITDSYAKL